MVNTLLMATSIGKAKGHKLLGNQCAKGRAAKLLRIFESAMTDFTEQLHVIDLSLWHLVPLASGILWHPSRKPVTRMNTLRIGNAFEVKVLNIEARMEQGKDDGGRYWKLYW